MFVKHFFLLKLSIVVNHKITVLYKDVVWTVDIYFVNNCWVYSLIEQQN